MQVLAITNEFPLPLDRGGPMRYIGQLRSLAAEHRVHLLALRRPNTTPELVRELEAELGEAVEVFAASAAGGGPARRWARALVAGVPPWITAQHSVPLERRAVELAPAADVAVLLDDYAGIYAAALAPLVPVVADKANVLGWSAAQADAHGAAQRAHRRLATNLVRRFERRCLRHVNGLIATSPDESVRLERLYGRPADAIVPSAIDLPPEAPSSDAGGRTVGWLGSHGYAANVDGLLRFVQGGWPRLASHGARLRVAGGGPPDSVRRLDDLPGIEVLGFVDDLDEFNAGLAAAVVPLWRGAGVKLKTLAFMGAGVPVAGTPVAFEGIEAEHGRHCLVAGDPAELAEAVRELLDDPERARRIGLEGRKLVADRYTWGSVGPRFREAVERAAASARP